MKTGILLIVGVAGLIFAGEASVAQDLPLRAQLAEPDDAPPPAADVFEAGPPARGTPIPAPFPTEPPRSVRPDGTFEPAPGEGHSVDRVRVQLADSSQLVGEIASQTPLVIRAKWGEVKLTFEEIARIDPAVDDGHWRVTLAGGDRITGALKLAGIKLKTAVGEVPLSEKQLVALEAGKLYAQHVAVARTSADGRTTSVAYRERHIFVPLVPDASGNTASMSTSPGTYGIMSPYAPTFPTPTPAFSVPSAEAPTLRPAIVE